MSTAAGPRGLTAEHQAKLLGCVHCGLCLSTCPTYTELGNEADSPRGRLHLMRAVAEGRLEAQSPAFVEHIDRCLGCRACESVCPAGVEFGDLLANARTEIEALEGVGPLTRMLLWLVASPALSRAVFAVGRALRLIPLSPLGGPLRHALALLEGSRPDEAWRSARPTPHAAPLPPPALASPGPKVAVLQGCVQAGLFARIHEATCRVLRAHGCEVVPLEAYACCGALHSHAGARADAVALASRQLEAFERSGAELMVADAAGCALALKEYPSLFDEPAAVARAKAFASRVRDVTELLVALGPRPGAALPLSVAYTAPCHLHHGQKLKVAAPHVLDSIPGLERRPVRDAERCCGGAGMYSLLHPGLSTRILDDKVLAVTATGAAVVATANVGCMLQLRAGLRARGDARPVLHVVELVDESYRRGGLYDPTSPRAPR